MRPLALCVVLVLAACPRASTPQPPRPPAAVTAACDRIRAHNRTLDEAARADFTAGQAAGAIPIEWPVPAPWWGECVLTRDGAWTVAFDEVAFGGTHAIRWTVVHIDAAGAMAPAAVGVDFNYMQFAWEVAADGRSAIVRIVSEGPEIEARHSYGYVWDGTAVWCARGTQGTDCWLPP